MFAQPFCQLAPAHPGHDDIGEQQVQLSTVLFA